MGPSKRLGKRGFRGISKDTEEGIQNALSEALSAPDTRSMRQKLEDKVSNWGRKQQDTMSEFRLTGDVQKYKCGGTVKHGYAVGGDVRYNNKGKCY